MITDNLVKHIEKYERLSNKLFTLKNPGKIRSSKGELCVSTCCSLLKDIIGDDPSFEINQKYKIETELETTEVDVCVTKNGTPFCIVECKAPNFLINQKVFDQIAQYNLTLDTSFMMITNGIHHYYCTMDKSKKTYQFLEALPDYLSQNNKK